MQCCPRSLLCRSSSHLFFTLTLHKGCRRPANAPPLNGAGEEFEWLRQAPLADLTALRERLHTDLGARLGCSDGDVVRSARSYWLANAHLAVPIPPMAALARAAAHRGPVAVASANDGAIVRAGLAAAGLSDVVTVVVAREDVTRLKPAPDAYEAAARLLSVPAARCLAYENTDEGVTAARAAGMHVIDVRHPTRTLHPDRTPDPAPAPERARTLPLDEHQERP
ncbi:HAD family hydrolase [Streptomyces sp. NPDC127069]|uniref:HAD family hydrolase n=1 Tax=Streptomyces sp. NPDC127069 TaxID=3347128 RepID=UPI00364B3CFB